jgi:hypothetical protein
MSNKLENQVIYSSVEYLNTKLPDLSEGDVYGYPIQMLLSIYEAIIEGGNTILLFEMEDKCFYMQGYMFNVEKKPLPFFLDREGELKDWDFCILTCDLEGEQTNFYFNEGKWVKYITHLK